MRIEHTLIKWDEMNGLELISLANDTEEIKGNGMSSVRVGQKREFRVGRGSMVGVFESTWTYASTGNMCVFWVLVED